MSEDDVSLLAGWFGDWESVRSMAPGNREAAAREKLQLNRELPRAEWPRRRALVIKGQLAVWSDDEETGCSVGEQLRSMGDDASEYPSERPVLKAMEARGWDRCESTTWFEVVEAEPDPKVVTDEDAIAKIKQSGKPWKVRHRKSGIVFVLCPPGKFRMGSPLSEVGRPAVEGEEHEHDRSITQAFYLSQFEVTQREWKRVMGGSPALRVGGELPVERVSWSGAQDFARRAGRGVRLPSEAEWEYACRAGSPKSIGRARLTDMAWYQDNSSEGGTERRTQRGGQKAPNAWGLSDMLGNVAEWCQDTWGEYPEAGGTEAAANASPETRERVHRGGSGNDIDIVCREAARGHADIDTKSEWIGVRLARTAD
jgi:formylglycine-generating enzyme required for sulfatase activity